MDDRKLIALFENRDPEAIGQAKAEFNGLCRSIAGKLLRSDEDVSECVNDTFLALWNAIPPAKPAPLSAYIAKITRNLALKKLEHLSAEKRNREAEISFEELDGCMAAPGGPEELLERIALRQAMEDFLRQQTQENRILFLRRYFFFDSVQEIAARYRMSQSKVKSSLLRTRNKLKIYLTQEGFDL